MPDPSRTVATEEFYVGYLPMPAGLTFYVRMLMPVALWLAIGAAALMSTSQFDPGEGIWHSGTPQPFEGVVVARPYPMLRVPGGANGAPFTTFLIVETGKFGGGRRAAPYDGQYVRVSGWLIERDGRRMIELDPGDAAIEPLPDKSSNDIAALVDVPIQSLGGITRRGEIVDSKCFLGVMKPGYGKTHKECATLCIAGGIPPLLVTREPGGSRRYYLLTAPDGGPLGADLLPLVADPVEVKGQLEQWGDLSVLRVDAAPIRRL